MYLRSLWNKITHYYIQTPKRYIVNFPTTNNLGGIICTDVLNFDLYLCEEKNKSCILLMIVGDKWLI